MQAGADPPESGSRCVFEAPDLPRTGGAAAIRDAAVRLASGGIVAVRGPAGFRLAADARDGAAVVRLRSRRQRDLEPFAVMVADAAVAREVAVLSAAEEALLASEPRPVVLLRARDPSPVAQAVAPGQRILGVMLPASPLDRLLLEAFAAVREGGGPAILVVTG